MTSAPPGEPAHLVDEIGGGVVDPLVQAQRRQTRQLLVARGRGQRAPGATGQAAQRRSPRRSLRVHEHRLAALESPELEETVIGGAEGDRDTRRFFDGQIGRHQPTERCRHGPSSASDPSSRRSRRDPRRKILPPRPPRPPPCRRTGIPRRAGGCLIPPSPGRGFPAFDADRFDRHEQVPGARHPDQEPLRNADPGPARLVVDGCFHERHPPSEPAIDGSSARRCFGLKSPTMPEVVGPGRAGTRMRCGADGLRTVEVDPASRPASSCPSRRWRSPSPGTSRPLTSSASTTPQRNGIADGRRRWRAAQRQRDEQDQTVSDAMRILYAAVKPDALFMNDVGRGVDRRPTSALSDSSCGQHGSGSGRWHRRHRQRVGSEIGVDSAIQSVSSATVQEQTSAKGSDHRRVRRRPRGRIRCISFRTRQTPQSRTERNHDHDATLGHPTNV